MGHASSWKNPSTHITYKRGDKIVVTGTIQNSADGKSGTWGSVTKQTYYFYSYFTADWTVRAPICIGQSPGSAWAFIKADAIVSGGTKESYTIKYDANGGTGAPANQTKYYATNITLSKTLPTRAGHTFSKWNTKKDGTGTSYAAGATFKANAATTLYAQWEVDNVCAIKTASGWKFGIAYIKVNGKWVQGEHVYIKVNGKWKLGTR